MNMKAGFKTSSSKYLSAIAICTIVMMAYSAIHYITLNKSKNVPSRIIKTENIGTQSNPQPTQNQNSITTETLSPISNTMSYQGKSGIQISMPKTWYTPEDIEGNSNESNGSYVSNEKVRLPALISNNGIIAYLTKLPYDPTTDNGGRDYLVINSKGGEIISGQYGTAGDVLTRLSNVTISGISAIHFTEDFSSDPTVKPNFEDIYLLNKGGQYYEIEFMMMKASSSNFTTAIQGIISSTNVSNK